MAPASPYPLGRPHACPLGLPVAHGCFLFAGAKPHLWAGHGPSPRRGLRASSGKQRGCISTENTGHLRGRRRRHQELQRKGIRTARTPCCGATCQRVPRLQGTPPPPAASPQASPHRPTSHASARRRPRGPSQHGAHSGLPAP